MTISNEEAERISDSIRRDKGIDVTGFDSEDDLVRELESLFESQKNPLTGEETNRLANLRKVKDIIIGRFVEEWREKKQAKPKPEEVGVSEDVMRELIARIRSISQLENAIEQGLITKDQAERLRPYIERIEAGEEIEIGRDVTFAEIIGTREGRKVEIGEVPTIPLPKEEKPKLPEYPPQTFTERERRLIDEINRKVAERTSPQRITGTVQRTVFGVRDAVVNVGGKVVDAVKNVVDWVKRRLGGD